MDLSSIPLSPESNQSMASPQTIENTLDKPKGIRLNTHGILYQVKLLMRCILNGMRHKQKFSIGTEVTEAEKFDDIVFSCQKDDSADREYRFVQAKHRQDETKKIRAEDLLRERDDDFSLQKYFVSYRKIRKNAKFNGDHKYFMLYTNIDLDGDVLKSVVEVHCNDEVFGNTDHVKGKQYKIKKGSDLHKKLVLLFKRNNVRKVADQIAKSIVIKKMEPHSLISCYRDWLLQNVFELEYGNETDYNMKFRDNFLQNQYTDDKCLKQFKNEIIRSYYSLRKSETVNDLDTILQNAAIAVPKKFNFKDDCLPLDVSDIEIDMFFDKLVLSVNQPNVKELGNIIAQEISSLSGDVGNVTKGKLMSSKFLEFVFDWVTEDVGRFLHSNDIEKTLQSLQRDIARLEAIDISNTIQNIYKFGNNGNVIEEVRELFRSENKQVLTVYYEHNLLTAMKIIQVSTENKDDDIFIDLKTLEELKRIATCSKEGFRLDGYDHLIIYIDPTAILTDVKSILKFYFESVKNNLKKRTILMIPRKQQDVAKEMLNEIFQELALNNYTDTIVDEENNLVDMTIESQQKLIEVSKVIFQGKEVTLNTLIDEENIHLVFGETLIKLISNEIPVVGKSLKDENYKQIEEHFVKREFQRKYKIRESIMNDKTSFHIATNNRIAKSDLQPNQEIILISNNESYFLDLCQEYTNRTIHWLKTGQEYSCDGCDITVLPNSQATENGIQSKPVVVVVSDETHEYDKLRELYEDKSIYLIGSKEHNLLAQHLGSKDQKKYVALPNQTKVLQNGEEYEIKSLLKYKVIIYFNDFENDILLKGLHERNTFTDLYEIKCNNALYWQQSHGNLSNIHTYVEDIQRKIYTSKEVTTTSDKVVIITAEPGMGKSTLVTHYALNVEIDPVLGVQWVVRTNLRNYLKQFLKLTALDKDEAIMFLFKFAFDIFDENINIHEFINIAGDDVELKLGNEDNLPCNAFELNLFTQFYNHGRIIVFLDGFDEIIPKCKNLVTDLIEALKCSKVYKIFVTTRPYNIQCELENRLGTFAFEIAPLQKKEQVYILNKIWENRLGVSIDMCHSDVFISKIWEIIWHNVHPSTSSQESFISNPLHITMIAIVFENVFKKFHSKNDNYVELFSNVRKEFSLYDLYTKFIEMKLDIIYGLDSWSTTMTHCNARNALRKNAWDSHRYLAMLELFTEDDLNKIFSKGKLTAVRHMLRSIVIGTEKIGLIDRVEGNKPQFVHRTFAEYLAADLLSSMMDPNDETYAPDNVTDFLYDIVTRPDSQSLVIFKFWSYRLLANDKDVDMLTAALNGHINETTIYKDVDIPDSCGRTPLHLACYSRQYRHIINILFPKSLNIDESTIKNLLLVDKLFGWTPLHYAVISCTSFQCIDFLQRVLGEGLRVKDRNGRTPLMLAIQMGYDIDSLGVMMNDKPSRELQDKDGRSALHYAVEHAHHLVPYLIASGDDPFQEDDKGKTPLHTIFETQSASAWNYYLQEIIGSRQEQLILHVIVLLKHTTNNFKVQLLCISLQSIIFFLSNSLIDVNTEDDVGKTALHYVAENDVRGLKLSILFIYKANINKEDGLGKTPLHYALPHKDLVLKLVLYGAHFDVVDTDDLPPNHVLTIIGQLFCNVKKNNIDKVKSILDGNENLISSIINAKSKDEGRMPLDLATRRGFQCMVEVLKSHKAISSTCHIREY